MARSRNIKPGFFKNEDLAELEPLTRLLFAGLWTIADREGRLEDRPKKIKVEVLPYDDCDCDAMLVHLHAKGFVQRYEAAGKRYIELCAWWKHQNPHVKEPASDIPAPDKNSTRTVLSPVQPGSSPADSLSLDSLNQIPEKTKARAAPVRLPIPDWVPAEAWELFCEHRGAKFNAKAQGLTLKKLETLRGQGSPPREVLEQSVMNGWKGIFEIKGNRHVSKSDARAETIAGFLKPSATERDITADSAVVG